jgi:ApaG protein
MTTNSDTATTAGIQVEVTSWYAPERSAPLASQWLFLYEIRITNVGDAPATLRRRHWVIRSADGEVREVEGPGVVGEEPRLEPGDSFRYVSGCPLATPFGTMEGTYTLERDDGSSFEARIPQFRLAQPYAVN